MSSHALRARLRIAGSSRHVELLTGQLTSTPEKLSSVQKPSSVRRCLESDLDLGVRPEGVLPEALGGRSDAATVIRHTCAVTVLTQRVEFDDTKAVA